MEKEIELLKAELGVLKDALQEEQLHRRHLLVSQQKQAFIKLRAAILDSSELQNNYESLLRELNLADFLGLVAEINSPTSDKMGFTLIEVVYEAVDKVLLPLNGGEDRDNHKRRFKEILKKIFDNPIASAVINSNPVTGVIGKVVDFASGFVDSVIDRSLGGSARKIKVVTSEVINADRIKAFASGMKKYEVLYGDLATALQAFRSSLSHVKSGMQNSLLEYGSAYDQFLNLLSLDIKDPFVGLDKVFRLADEGWDGLSEATLAEVTGDDRIAKALRFVNEMQNAEVRLSSLRGQFSTAQITFKKRLVEVLRRPLEEGWEDARVDQDRLRETINEIQLLTERSSSLMASMA
ncbi:hypothetical protein [Neolewinella agarilytica]|uniref:Uncharacterized protein n=1 Tax=Neolewinella agarilytica TaxID=478744 RepID=A0A1H9H9D8_9BACT|nr:hypothetical protein [Neolewinella agarilytica]SEQ58950.1 hypothetical protein SAMN05444359_11269 [Neolewinella agarilytica]